MKQVLFALALAGLTMAAVAQDAIPKPTGNLRYSITVSKFENNAGWEGHWDIGNGFGEIMTMALQTSGWFVVLGEKDMRQEAMAEQEFAASGRAAGGKKAPQMGRMTPAQLLVKGSITHVQNDTTGGSGGINIRGLRLGGSGGKAEVNITIYLVDSATGQVRASTKVVGQAGRKGISFGYSGGLLGGLGGDFDAMKKDNVGKACEDAVGQAVQFLVQQLDKVKWEGGVMLVKGDRVTINRGSREGVQVGNKFEIGTTEELVDDDTGEVLDVELTKAGAIEIVEVKEKIAHGKLLEGAKIEKGMSVLPLK